jgi:hypothetical protein
MKLKRPEQKNFVLKIQDRHFNEFDFNTLIYSKSERQQKDENM